MTALWRHRMERSGLDLAVIAYICVTYILFDWPRITSVHSKITPLFGPPSVWIIHNFGEIINLGSDRNSCDDKIIIHDVSSRLVEDLFMLNFVTLISFFLLFRMALYLFCVSWLDTVSKAIMAYELKFDIEPFAMCCTHCLVIGDYPRFTGCFSRLGLVSCNPSYYLMTANIIFIPGDGNDSTMVTALYLCIRITMTS